MDHGRAQETPEQFADILIVTDDPEAKMARYSAEVREAIKNGQIVNRNKLHSNRAALFLMVY